MKIPRLLSLVLGVNLNAAANATFSIGPTLSGGEIDKAYSYDMYGSAGIYEFGLSVSGEMKHAESSLQIETGWYNRSQAYGVGLDWSGKYGMFQDRVKLYAGFGFAYNGYVYDYWVGERSIVGEFTHEFSPYLTAKTELFNTVRLGFEGIFDSKIYWKARLGLALLHF